MESRDFEGFFGLLKEVAELYGTRLSEKRAELFFEACRGLSLESFAEGVRRHIRWGSFFPAPAEVFKALYGTHEDQATMAWCDVLEAIRRTGAEGPVKFADYRIHYAIERMGGWAHVAWAVGEKKRWPMKDFIYWYVFALKINVDADDVKPYLMGNRGLPYKAGPEDIARMTLEVPAEQTRGLRRVL